MIIAKTKKGLTNMMKKERLDVLLVERGLFETREKAKRSIMAGIVFSNEDAIRKTRGKSS